MGTKERFSDGFFYTRRIKRKVFLTIGFYILLYIGDFVNHYIPVPSPEEEVCEDKILLFERQEFQMKFYSEKLNKLFETEKECAEAESAHEKALAEAEAKKKVLAEERASRAKEVEDAYKAAFEAKKLYNQKLDSFLRDYKQFHMTFTSMDPFEPWFRSWF